MSRGRIRAVAVLATVSAAVGGGCWHGQTPTTAPQLSPRELVARWSPSLVRVEVDAVEPALGSGFVLSENGLIATSLHLLVGATGATVRTADDVRHRVLRVIAVDEERDLALLQVAATGLHPVRLGDSDDVAAGDRVYAMGSPLGLDASISEGLIGAVRQVSAELTVLQITAPVSDGSSGGPLFNTHGDVIGMTASQQDRGQNINFGMPSNYVRALAQQATAGGASARPEWPLDGVIRGAALPVKRGTAVGRRDAVHVPRSEAASEASCSQSTMIAAAHEMNRAVEACAPLYERGELQTCFEICDAAAARAKELFETAECGWAAEILKQGRRRAEARASNLDKTWALRNTFQELVLAIARTIEVGTPPR